MIAGPVLAGPPASQEAERWIVETPVAARRAVDSLAALGVDLVKVWDGIPRDACLAVVARARELRLPVAGHVPAQLDSLLAISRSDSTSAIFPPSKLLVASLRNNL